MPGSVLRATELPLDTVGSAGSMLLQPRRARAGAREVHPAVAAAADAAGRAQLHEESILLPLTLQRARRCTRSLSCCRCCR